jgi:hypothetical protein
MILNTLFKTSKSETLSEINPFEDNPLKLVPFENTLTFPKSPRGKYFTKNLEEMKEVQKLLNSLDCNWSSKVTENPNEWSVKYSFSVNQEQYQKYQEYMIRREYELREISEGVYKCDFDFGARWGMRGPVKNIINSYSYLYGIEIHKLDEFNYGSYSSFRVKTRGTKENLLNFQSEMNKILRQYTF